MNIKNNSFLRKFKKNTLVFAIYSKLILTPKKRKRVNAFNKNGILVLKKVIGALENSNLKYFAAFGTLLGFYRDGGIIPHDCDFDFGIIKTSDFNWDTLNDLLAKEGFEIKHYFTINNKIYETTYYNRIDKNVTVDFFLFEPDSNLTKYNEYSFWRLDNVKYDTAMQASVCKAEFPYFTDLKYITIYDTRVPIPIIAEQILEASYTTNWRIPDPNFSFQDQPNSIIIDNLFGNRVDINH